MNTNDKPIPRVTPDRIAALMLRVSYDFYVIPGTTTTLCTALLDGTFSLAIGHSACVDPRLFDKAKGEEIAQKEAKALAEDKLWTLEGWVLYRSITEAGSQVETIARVAHEVNKAYCEALGDTSQPAWEQAPDWQRSSAALGVKLHLSGEHGPEASHASWFAQKQAEGWVYGETKDPVLKTHPCMVEFSALPPNQQAKDYIFRGVVHAMKGIN